MFADLDAYRSDEEAVETATTDNQAPTKTGYAALPLIHTSQDTIQLITNANNRDYQGHVAIHSAGFRDFLLKPELLRAIVDCGFEVRTPDQRICV